MIYAEIETNGDSVGSTHLCVESSSLQKILVISCLMILLGMDF